MGSFQPLYQLGSIWQRCFAATISVAAFVTFSAPSYAIFDAQALVGQRTGTFKVKDADDSSKLEGTEMTVAAHVDPIPLVPVAFGASFNLQTWDKDKLEVKSVESSLINVEIMAWLPMVPVVTPYAKVGYTVLGAFHTKSETDLGAGAVEVDSVYKMSGYDITVGVNYGIVPMVGLIAEFDMGSHTAEPDKVKVSGAEVDSAAYKATVDSTAFRIGVQVGL